MGWVGTDGNKCTDSMSAQVVLIESSTIFYAGIVFQSNWPVNKFIAQPQQNYMATGW